MKTQDRITDVRAQLASAMAATIPTPTARDLLPAVGDGLRRSVALDLDLGDVDAALERLPPAEVQSYLDSLALDEAAEALARAADEALEAALAESGEDRQLWAASATDALFARDRAESVLAAAERCAALGVGIDATGLKTRLLALDRRLRAKARTLTPLNERRRLESELLDAAHRDPAWWFTARSQCDQLVPMLAGEVEPKGPHLATCSECQRDLSLVSFVDGPTPPRHVTSDEAFRLELGQLSSTERARLRAHADDCLECSQVLWAMEEGHKAIAQLEAAPPGPGPGPTRAGPSARRRDHTELIRRDSFRVIRIRGEHTRILFQPLRGHSFAVAVISVPPQRNVFQGSDTKDGLEFDLGPTGELQGRMARLTVRERDDGPNEVLELEL